MPARCPRPTVDVNRGMEPFGPRTGRRRRPYGRSRGRGATSSRESGIRVTVVSPGWIDTHESAAINGGEEAKPAIREHAAATVAKGLWVDPRRLSRP
jgi:hypothetical protein